MHACELYQRMQEGRVLPYDVVWACKMRADYCLVEKKIS